MTNEIKVTPTLVVTADESFHLIDENTTIPKSVTLNIDANMLLTRKTLVQHRLMRWCSLIFVLGTILIVWRYVSILILATWLATLCKPLLEWLVVHL